MTLEDVIEATVRRVLREELQRLVGPTLVPPPLAPFMSVEEIATACEVEPPAVRSWISSGRLKASKPGRHYLVRRGDFDTFMAERDVSPVPRVDGGEQVRLLLARVGAKKGNGNG